MTIDFDKLIGIMKLMSNHMYRLGLITWRHAGIDHIQKTIDDEVFSGNTTNLHHVTALREMVVKQNQETIKCLTGLRDLFRAGTNEINKILRQIENVDSNDKKR